MRNFAMSASGCLAAAFALAICAAPNASGAKAAPEVQMFTTQARLTVNARGEVERIEPDAKLAPAVQQLIRKSADDWLFVPALHQGRPVGGVTNATLRACAADVDGDFRMQVMLAGTGPRTADGAPSFPPITSLKVGELARFRLTYRVAPDGTGAMEDVEVIEGRPSLRKPAQRAAARWMTGQRFVPEQLDGQPVPTRVRAEMSMASGTSIEEIMKRMPETKAIAAHKRDCQSALTQASTEDRTSTTALDSPFRLMPPAS